MKKTTLICTLILVSLLSGCAGNNASQPATVEELAKTAGVNIDTARELKEIIDEM